MVWRLSATCLVANWYKYDDNNLNERNIRVLSKGLLVVVVRE